MDDNDRRLARIATTINNAPVSRLPMLAARGFLVGAVYSLFQANRLGYQARAGASLGDTYQAELCAVADGLASGRVPESGPWLAGYYFAAAKFRLAVLFERSLKMLLGKNGIRKDLQEEAVARGLLSSEDAAWLENVFRDFNEVKHVGDVMKSLQKIDTIDDAVRVAELLAGLLQRISSQHGQTEPGAAPDPPG